MPAVFEAAVTYVNDSYPIVVKTVPGFNKGRVIIIQNELPVYENKQIKAPVNLNLCYTRVEFRILSTKRRHSTSCP